MAVFDGTFVRAICILQQQQEQQQEEEEEEKTVTSPYILVKI